MIANDRFVMDTGITQVIEEPFSDGEGRPRVYLSTKSPLRDETGALIGVVGVAHDITERKRVDEGLAQRERIIEAFFASSPAILNIADEELRFLKTDPTTPTYFGLNRETILGKSLTDLAPDFGRAYGSMLRRVVETGEPIQNVEVQSPVRRRSGETAYWRASYFPVPCRTGRPGSAWWAWKPPR